MTEKVSILVVDDEPLNFELMKFALKDHYDLHHVTSGEGCLAFLEQQSPQLILLDIRMPGMDGYEVCKKIKADDRFAAIPVIFVSSLDNLEERLAGYDAGGDDYVVKPFSAEELLRKVRITLAYKKKFGDMESQKNFATQAVLEALTTSGELGVVIQFLTRSHSCDDSDCLARIIVEALAGYGLNAVLLIDLRGKTSLFDSDGAVKPLEGALLTKIRTQGRFYDFGARMAINYPNVSVLIKNMPVDDPAKNGRYRDNLALLVEGAQSRVSGMIAESILREQKQVFTHLIEKHHAILSDVRAANDKNKKMNAHILDDLVSKMESEFPTLGLSEIQEEKLINIVSTVAEQGANLYSEGLHVDTQLSELLTELKKFSS